MTNEQAQLLKEVMTYSVESTVARMVDMELGNQFYAHLEDEEDKNAEDLGKFYARKVAKGLMFDLKI